MTGFEEVHVLCQELIPMYDDLDVPAKRVIEKHAEECEVCRMNLTASKKIEIGPREAGENDSLPVQPFKKLILLKKFLTLFLFFIRTVVIGLIAFDFFRHFSPAVPYGLQFEGLRASLVIFYVPLAFFLLLFTWFMKNGKIFWITLIIDLLVIYFFDDAVRFFVRY